MDEEELQKLPIQTVSTAVQEEPKASPSLLRAVCSRLHARSGIWYALGESIIFSCCTFTLKLIPADMLDIMIMRFLIQAVVFGSYAAFYKHYNVFDTNGQRLACAMNVLMSSGANLTFLAAFYFLPLSDLVAIKYTYIVWAAFLAVVFLKDRFKLVNGISLFFTVIGLALATKPHFFIKTLSHIFDQPSKPTTTAIMTTANDTSISSAAQTSSYYYLGVTLAVLSSLAKAIQIIARKQLLNTKLPYSVMNFQFTGFALIVAVLYSIIRRFWLPEPYPWKWMFTVGVVIGCCQLVSNTFYVKALKRENVQLISILGTFEILYACLLQYVFLRLTKSWMFYVGASLIVLSASVLCIDSYLATRDQKKRTANDENQNNGV